MQIGKLDVIVDEDGIGGGLVDFCGYRGFVNNSTPVNLRFDEWGKPVKENFDNLKSQCYFRISERINKNELYIAEKECVGKPA